MAERKKGRIAFSATTSERELVNFVHFIYRYFAFLLKNFELDITSGTHSH